MNPKTICSYMVASNAVKEKGNMWMAPFPTHKMAGVTSSGDNCPYCLSPLEKRVIFRWSEALSNGLMNLYVCPICGWWERSERNAWATEQNGEIWSVEYYIGQAKHYDISDIDVPIQDLRRFLRRHPTYLAYVNPIAFEKLMADCLKSMYGPCEVIHLGRSGDGGIDLKLTRGDMGTFLIQVKRRGNLSAKEGVQVVRELNGVLFREGQAKGMVITTAREFTPAAYGETVIRTPTTQRYEVKLVAFDDIVSMLNLPNSEPYEPWEHATKYIPKI